ncbi:MAG: hypothetical protein LBR51_06290 [Bacteroidales bacterium]|jgi:hypothetical protein|nr:hypothetical protein [Bacteroidales bacterium]
MEKKTITSSTKSSENNHTLTLQLANQQLIHDNTTGKYHIRFDVLVNSNHPNLYLDYATLFINYEDQYFNSEAIDNFPSNYVQSVDIDGVSVWKGEAFGQENYKFCLARAESNVICLEISNWIDENRTVLDTVPVPLLHFQLELQNNLSQVQSFFAFSPYYHVNPTNHSQYTTIQSYASGYYAFSNVFLLPSDTLTISTLAAPIITGFDASLKIAGIGDTLSINGAHFGTGRGTVLFKNANRGGATFLKGLDDQYFVSWSDSLIKVLVPSLVYQVHNSNTYEYQGGAGSGQVKIKTAAGDSCVSNTSLDIPVSVINARRLNGNIIRRVYMSRKNCNYDFQFTLHSHYQNDNTKISVIDTALRR